MVVAPLARYDVARWKALQGATSIRGCSIWFLRATTNAQHVAWYLSMYNSAECLTEKTVGVGIVFVFEGNRRLMPGVWGKRASYFTKAIGVFIVV